jgi:1,4-dihydroxy-2-naphthoyl-CoA hydrolase
MISDGPAAAGHRLDTLRGMSSDAPESPVPASDSAAAAATSSARSPYSAPVLPTDPSELAVVEALRHIGLGALPDHMGVELLEVGAERTVARMPVVGNTQPYGLLHGGASAVLAESVGSIASALHAGPNRIALGLELNCTHHKAMREGYVIATATPLVRGRTVACYAISITDEDGAPVCTARLTCVLRDR